MMSFRFLLVLLLTIAAASAARGQMVDPLIPNYALVKVATGFTVQDFIDAFEADFPGIEFALADSVPGRPIHLLQYTGNTAVIDQAFGDKDDPTTWVNTTPYLELGELLYEGQAPEGRTETIWVASVGNFSQYHNQYARNLLGLDAAHQRSTGFGTTIAVLDTGIDASHPALAGHVVPGANFITAGNVAGSSDGTADVGNNLDDDGDGDIDEMTGHGTFVAGLLALTAPHAKLLPVVVLNSDGVGDGWSFIRGVYHAMDQSVDVINMSLGTTYDSDILEEAIEEAQMQGIFVASAAGNQSVEDPEEHPATYSNGDGGGTAALLPNDVAAQFTNYNEDLLLSAPGGNFYVGGNPDNPNPSQSIISTIPGGGYAVWEGTSFAVPWVAGTAALIRAQHPEWDDGATSGEVGFCFDHQLSSTELIEHAIRCHITATSVYIYGLNPGFAEDQELGAGRLDTEAAIELGPIAPMPAPADLNTDGQVNAADLALLLGAWSIPSSSPGCQGAQPCAADLNGDGFVNAADLALLLGSWG